MWIFQPLSESAALQAGGGASSVTLTGIPSGETFGTTALSFHTTVAPAGIASGEAFGDTVFNAGDLILLSGIPSAEAFGTQVFSFRTNVALTGIASAEAFGTHSFSSGGLTNIRLSIALEMERGAEFASASSLKYNVYNADHTDIIASGTALTTDVNGVAVIDVNNTSYAIGAYVPVLIVDYNAATAAPDRVVRTFFGFVPAAAQP